MTGLRRLGGSFAEWLGMIRDLRAETGEGLPGSLDETPGLRVLDRVPGRPTTILAGDYPDEPDVVIEVVAANESACAHLIAALILVLPHLDRLGDLLDALISDAPSPHLDRLAELLDEKVTPA